MIILFSLSAFGIFLVFIGYPLLLFVMSWLRPLPHHRDPSYTPTVTLIIACHNPGALLQRKIDNSLALDYPPEKLSILIVSDGSTDGTAETLKTLTNPRIRGITLERHDGKAAALNKAIELAASETLVFSDVDALLPADTLRILMSHFADPSIGGVCGQRVLIKGEAALHDAQASYVGWDSRIKQLESQIGSTTSNDGKLYALRREAAGVIADGVTDDLYAALGAINRGWRFVFDGEAHALVPTPAKSPEHEITRRRRVVARSLRGIFLRRSALDPRHSGFYAVALLINKVMRRGLPLMLLLLLFANLWLAAESSVLAALLAVQLAFYGLAGLGHLHRNWRGPLGPIARRSSYLLLGMLGTGLGVWDFLRGRSITAWTPLKDQLHRQD